MLALQPSWQAVRGEVPLRYVYLDFDSFFASVEQQRRPELRGRPVGITPSPVQMGGTIAVSREAKRAGVSRVGGRKAALAICPDMAFVPQDPSHYIAVHHRALAAIDTVVPVHEVRGVDELSIRLTPGEARDPEGLAARINAALADAIGPHITASLGFSANRVLAKMASAYDKPCGVTVWDPADMPGPILDLPFAAVPGIGERMERRLVAAGVPDIPAFLAIGPKHARRIWGNVNGERMWRYLHGEEVEEPATQTSMIGHGRDLPRRWRGLEEPYHVARFLTVKAARRMRRWDYAARHLYLGVKFRDPEMEQNVYTRDAERAEQFRKWATETDMTFDNDDHACLAALDRNWARLVGVTKPVAGTVNVAHVQVAFTGLRPLAERQADLFADTRPNAEKWRRVTEAVDHLTTRYQKTCITQGVWKEPPGGNAGTKIAFGRVPEAEDAF